MPERDFKAVAEFAIPFAYAVGKLRKANDANEGVTLDADQVAALVDGLRMISAPLGDQETQ